MITDDHQKMYDDPLTESIILSYIPVRCFLSRKMSSRVAFLWMVRYPHRAYEIYRQCITPDSLMNRLLIIIANKFGIVPDDDDDGHYIINWALRKDAARVISVNPTNMGVARTATVMMNGGHLMGPKGSIRTPIDMVNLWPVGYRHIPAFVLAETPALRDDEMYKHALMAMNGCVYMRSMRIVYHAHLDARRDDSLARRDDSLARRDDSYMHPNYREMIQSKAIRNMNIGIARFLCCPIIADRIFMKLMPSYVTSSDDEKKKVVAEWLSVSMVTNRSP